MRQNLRIRLTSLIIALIIVISTISGCRPIISLDDIPEYTKYAYVEINGDTPFFTEDEITDVAFESYSPLDALGRCGVAFACIGIEIMPTEERDDIANVTPSGWEYNGVSNNNKYDFVENEYVYNRCHLIGFQLAGENDNENNLITGTRYMNIEGMLPFENMVADYVEDTENHVMYRVTPIYNGLDYVAQGVLMEAYSVEDNGRGVSFCIFAYNVQPGVLIDYYTGVNVASGESLPEIDTDDGRDEITETPSPDERPDDGIVGEITYVLNTNSKKFHKPSCTHAKNLTGENRKETDDKREELIAKGYSPCGTCKP
jgi:DNA-entry nuclease